MRVSGLRVFGGSLFALIATAIAIELGGVIIGTTSQTGQELGAMPLALPALWSFLILFLLSVVTFAVTKRPLLNRPELLCVLFVALMAAPIMSVGFWRKLVPTVGSFPRDRDFVTIDTLRPDFWPHGANLTDGVLNKGAIDEIMIHGAVQWKTVFLAGAAGESMPVLTNQSDEETSSLRIRLPVGENSDNTVIPGHSHLLSVLARGRNFGLNTIYYGRLYYDDSQKFDLEVFTSTKEGVRSFMHPDGFRRAGDYGIIPPRHIKKWVTIELGLVGAGQLELRDLQFLNVESLESAFSGRKFVSEKDYDRLPGSESTGIMVSPDNLFSLDGLVYLATAYIPWKDWVRPLLAWGSYLLLLLTGTFSLAVIMRTEWIDNQRFPLPLAQIPINLLGRQDDITRGENVIEADQGGGKGSSRIFQRIRNFLPACWSRGTFGVGFAVALVWCLLRGWHDFNPVVPDTNINVSLIQYIESPSLRLMLAPVHFQVLGIVLGLAAFLQLNVLMSLILGYFLYRAQFWFGEINGLSTHVNYPYTVYQQIVSYLVYAGLLIFFTRRYLWRFFAAALRGDDRSGEILSARGALLLIIGAIAGTAVWAHVVGLPVGGMLLLFVVLLVIGFVAMKIRAECGLPSYAFFPVSVVFLVALTGGMPAFGSAGTMFAIFASAIFAGSAFFLIPGLQLEFLELARGFQIRRRMVFFVNLLGILGGLLIGGWIFLSGAYAIGIDWFPNAADFDGPLSIEKTQTRQLFNDLHTQATRLMEGESVTETVKTKGQDLSIWCSLYAGGLIVLVTVLRQAFAGFWFHPVGIVAGATPGMDVIWGSLLVAWAARSFVLKMGGAATVREKLLPFFVGVFLASVTSQALFFLINVSLHFLTDSDTFQTGIF